ncbi:hypothetical protein JAAARDRAFT_119201 [Jaapia argillacea MUCL 33604]|uniref:Histone deacetylase interacting domain-containing protein n=1 Tax=Jaapia argillacea MUCL 33604 TaxID=933084 RepID=A0A067Q7W4_9AGAM|nr:hypothetical protein JAAARDRAFT_119201 [Jaapia argillacea MUCL 33604]
MPEEFQPPTGNASLSPETNRPLNVTDALSYLDAVKVQFQDKPDVYNHFLDIMKDFKSGLLDTPGVIQRVSMLFQGNPYLIQGFNTFLPPGYRIECSKDPSDPTILVTTPMGTITQSTNPFDPVPRMNRDAIGPGPAPIVSMAFPGPPLHGVSTPGIMSSSRPTTPLPYQYATTFHNMPTSYSPGPHTAAAATFLGGLGGRVINEGAPNGEFNHAIQFLNKIKTRFQDDPNIYKQFLEILQTYQKEQKHPHESQVYVQVQMLFRDSPELMREFKDFLPEVSGPQAPGSIGILPQLQGGPPLAAPSWSQQDPPPAPSDKLDNKAKAPPKRRKRPVEKETTPAPAPKVTNSRAKKPKTAHRQDSPPYSPYQVPPSPQNVPSHASGHNHLQSALPSSQISSASVSLMMGQTVTTSDELMFFDRAKKALESEGTYDEFLKLLNLFSKDIINTKTLIERAEAFLGDGDLLHQLKELMHWDDRRGTVEYGPPGSIRTGPPEALMAPPVNDGEGPSYRKLPESERKLACSGRDELCWSVLNDDWVSHPTWASEESGFVAHKKNTNEDALHKSEEERHEYHVHLSALSRTIAILDPLNNRINEMNHEDRTVFKLKPDLGGYSPHIYQRIIKKIYGREAGIEIYQALQDCPSVAVPVVLSRLKRKEEEWRRALREWSRTWKDADYKNFYKSLDYQSMNFKPNDKKNITAKHFVGDIESIKAEQAKERGDVHTFSFARGSLGYQLEYSFQDTAVLHDSLKLVYRFLEHCQAQYSPQERRRLERFLQSFVPLLCMDPGANLTEDWAQTDSGHDDDMDDGDDGVRPHSGGGRSANGGGNVGGVLPSDLRKQLWKTAQDRAAGGRATSAFTGSRSTSPGLGDVSSSNTHTVDNAKGRPTSRTEDMWIKESVTSLPPGIPSVGQSHVKRKPFFSNTTFYTLLRLLQLLYSRLLRCKEIGAKLAASQHRSLLANPIAVELGLDEPGGPATILGQAIEAFGEGPGTNVLYLYLLEACEKVFDNELDQATFEEHMRWFFGMDAYHVFTIDKLLVALIKQVHTIISDNKCQELWFLLQKARSAESLTTHDILRYRREAEQHVGSDDNLYRVEWERHSKTMRIQLVGADDPSVDEDTSAVGRWREYVDSYVTNLPTEWMGAAIAAKPSGPLFLKRFACLCLVADDAPTKIVAENGVAMRISLGTYKVFYESGTEDFMRREGGAEEVRMLRERAAARHEERKRSRWLFV